MSAVLTDLRLAIRVLWKDRGFTLTALATLALCLGANVAMLAVVNGVLLEPLPFPEAQRLVRIHNRYPGAGVAETDNAVPDYFDRMRDVRALESLAAFRTAGMTLSAGDGGDAERIETLTVTPSFFRVLRVAPARGRVFGDEHGEPGHDKVVVLTHGFWQRAFGGRDDVIGRDVRLGGESYAVVGVLPATFRFINPDIQVLRPAAFSAEERADEARHSNNWQQIGRLAPGATIQQAQSQVDAINAANAERFPQWREMLASARFSTAVRDFHEHLVGDTRATLTLLWGGALFVLLIGSVNVANLMLVRATSRVRELATRQALGATFARLARQAMTEAAVLACAGGVAGLALGWWALGAMPVLGFAQLPGGADIRLDLRVVAFTAGLVGLVGLTLALIPVLVMRHANVAQAIRDEGRSGTQGRRARTVRRLLVTSQVAFALMLLVGAGVLLASFARVLAIDPGFRAAQVVTATLSFPEARYPDNDALRAATARLLEQVRALPGVEAAGATTSLPLSGDYSDSVIVAEGYHLAPGESVVSPTRVRATDGYFEAMGVTLRAGRLFTPDDIEGHRGVLVIDETLARRFWPRGDAVGKRMYLPSSPDALAQKPPDDEMLTVVGVVAPIRVRGLVEGPGAERAGVYAMPYRQQPARTYFLAIRSTQAPDSVVSAVRRAVAGIDAELPLFGVQTMEERLSRSLVDRRTPMLLAWGGAVVALFLAAIGIYGMLAYQVAQRRREIGIRMALGADSGRILGLVLREGMRIVATGTALGLGGSFLVRHALEGQLYEVGAMDARVVAAVASLLATVALAACLLPARRAAKTDPMVALTEQ